MKRLWLDVDGCLANFDGYFEELFGLTSGMYEELNGSRAMWAAIKDSGDFFAALPLMPDAKELLEELRQYRPIMLTGTPIGNWAVIQKLKWQEKHFPNIPMITCRSKEKSKYCLPGDILVDDTLKYRHLWEQAGGHFVHHKAAGSSIQEVKHLWAL